MGIAHPGVGTLLKRGDGGTPGAVKAEYEFGSGDSSILFRAVTAGTGGNSITVVLVESGNSTPLSVSVVSNAITVNLETDGGGSAVSTVNDVISKIYQTAAASALVDALYGDSGDGTGVVVAATVQNLANGAAGTEAFTLVPGVLDLNGPNMTKDFIDTSDMDVTNRFRTYISGLRDGGQISGELNWNPSHAQHQGMQDDFDNDTLRNWTITWRDGTVCTLAAEVESLEITSAIDAQIKRSFTLKISGEPSFAYP